MANKWIVLTAVTLAVLIVQQVQAEFFYDPPKDLERSGKSCQPGRTVIKISSSRMDDDNETEEHSISRTHSNAADVDDTCQICVCSVNGGDEHCSKRAARNVNECMRMQEITKVWKRNEPFDHTKTIYSRIRRDLIWHKDEIPYNAKDTCRRGQSYYTNNNEAANTTLDRETNIPLDYKARDLCYFCVCHTSGKGIACIARRPWICAYFRYLRIPGSDRDMYAHIFQHDRPALFRQLSHRLRRTLDTGVYSLMETGGDALCCGHQDGHVKKLHNAVRNRIRFLRRKVPREDLIEGDPQGDYDDFVVNND